MNLIQIIDHEIRQFEETEWMKDALCKGMTNIFFAGRGENKKTEMAMLICKKCPVKEQCLDYAIRNREVIGVWGGYSERKRRIMRRNIRNEKEL